MIKPSFRFPPESWSESSKGTHSICAIGFPKVGNVTTRRAALFGAARLCNSVLTNSYTAPQRSLQKIRKVAVTIEPVLTLTEGKQRPHKTRVSFGDIRNQSS